MITADGWLPRNAHVFGKQQLLSLLSSWLTHSQSPTIGDTRKFHGTFWVTAEISGYKVRLAADTTRAAVRQFVVEVTPHPERPWRVIRNERGRINKVQATERPLSGWFAYVHPPLPSEIEI